MAKTKKPTKRAAKKASPAAKNSGTKGKRYSATEKKKVLTLVEKVNAAKGRGGVTAAAKKFGVTQLTISNWLKKAGGAVKAAAAPKSAGGRSKSKPTDVLDQLVALRDEISALESQLASKRAQFDNLKGKL